MKVCPDCRRCFSDASIACMETGHAALVPGPPIPNSIAEKWQLDRLLSTGAAGTAFLGRHQDLGRIVTVLVRRKPTPQEAEAFEHFRREAAALSLVADIHVAGVEDFGLLPGGGAYAVLEPPGEEMLRQALDREGHFPIARAASVGRQVAEAVVALRERGISAGELAAERIGLIRSGSGEFLAKLVRLPGTGDDVDAAGEIRRVGDLLYEMLSGRRPKAGSLPSPIQTSRAELPEALGWLVMQCLHPNPAGRPRSAAEIADRLRPFEAAPAAGSPSPAAPIAAPPAAIPARPATSPRGASPPPATPPEDSRRWSGPSQPAPTPPPSPSRRPSISVAASPMAARRPVSRSFFPPPPPPPISEGSPGRRPPASPPSQAKIASEIPILRLRSGSREDSPTAPGSPPPAPAPPAYVPRPMFLDFPPPEEPDPFSIAGKPPRKDPPARAAARSGLFDRPRVPVSPPRSDSAPFPERAPQSPVTGWAPLESALLPVTGWEPLESALASPAKPRSPATDPKEITAVQLFSAVREEKDDTEGIRAPAAEERADREIPQSRGPRAAVVWGIVAAIAAAIALVFLLVIETTPPRRAGPQLRPPASSARGFEAPVRAAPQAAPVPAPVESVPARALPRPADSPPRPVVEHTRRAAAPARSASRRPPKRFTAASEQAGLRDALEAWIESTNARDLSGHMRFYMPRVSTFYLARNVSRDSVRREKARLFGAGTVNVRAGEPEIEPSPDGRSATIRFRKRYVVAGPRNGERRGEVLQEMRWVRTPEGWRIVSERDAKVLASR